MENKNNFTVGTTFIKWFFSNKHNVIITILCVLILISLIINWDTTDFIIPLSVIILVIILALNFGMEAIRWSIEKRRLNDN